MKAVILARVSTKEQEEQGHSLPAQIRRLEEYAKKKGFEIAEIFSFSESAGNKIRKKFEEVMKYIKQNKDVKVLLCENVDRATRNFRDAVDLDEMRRNDDLEIHFVQDGFFINKNATGNQMFMWEAKVFLAKQYLNRLSDDVKRSNEQKIQNGEWINKAPVGYTNITNENGRKNIIPDPARSHYVARIFELYATGNYSLEAIKQEMEKVGLKSNCKIQIPLAKSLIYHILKNPFYYGMMRVKGKLYEHKYPPIIPKGLFDRVQDVMAGYSKKPFRYGCKPFALRAMVKCAECGCTITPEIKKGKYVYYSCSNYKKVHKTRIFVREEELLKPVYRALRGIQLKDEQINKLIVDLKQMNQAKSRFFQSSMEQLRADYDKYSKRISNLADKITDEEIDPEIGKEKMEEYKEKRAELFAEMKVHNEADEEYYITVNMILSLAKRAYQIFESSEPMKKRQFLNFLLQNCKLDGKKLIFELKTPFNRVLQANKCSSMLPLLNTLRTINWEAMRIEINSLNFIT